MKLTWAWLHSAALLHALVGCTTWTPQHIDLPALSLLQESPPAASPLIAG